MNILKITFKSVKRRYRQIIRAALTTLFAVFFCNSSSYISGKYVSVADAVQ